MKQATACCKGKCDTLCLPRLCQTWYLRGLSITVRATVRSFAQTNNTFGRTFDCCASQVITIRRSLRDSWAKFDVKLFCPVRHLDGSSPVKRESVARVDDFPDSHVHCSDDHQQKHVNSSHRRHLQQSVTSTPQAVSRVSVSQANQRGCAERIRPQPRQNAATHRW